MTDRRSLLESWLGAALAAVEPRALVRDHLAGAEDVKTVLAIGKAAAAMCWGAADALGQIRGICIGPSAEEVPTGVEMMVGEHPVPGLRSLEAGLAAMEWAPEADLALISGGGSALCEVPSTGVSLEVVAHVTRRLLASGADIEEANIVRSHLSAIKCGGLGSLDSLILSDVSGRSPGLVSSGPTVPVDHDVSDVARIAGTFGLDLPSVVRPDPPPGPGPNAHVIGDGKTAALGLAAEAAAHAPVTVEDGWLRGDAATAVEALLARSGPGVTVSAGETSVTFDRRGVGGRNTHAAVVAADLIHGTEWIFAALATDGIDGNSALSGAIVDGSTIDRGGDPEEALRSFDTGGYLHRSGDALSFGPTGTNVADVWVVWKP